MQIKNVPITKFLTKIILISPNSLLNRWSPSSPKISSLPRRWNCFFSKLGEVSGEGVEHDELNNDGLVEELEGDRYTLTWEIKVATGIKVTKVEVTGLDTKEEDATEVFWTKVDTPWLETSK